MTLRHLFASIIKKTQNILFSCCLFFFSVDRHGGTITRSITEEVTHILSERPVAISVPTAFACVSQYTTDTVFSLLFIRCESRVLMRVWCRLSGRGTPSRSRPSSVSALSVLSCRPFNVP